MYIVELNFDRPVSNQKVLDAIVSSLGNQTGLAVRTEIHQGDFPFLVRLTIPSATDAPSLDQFLSIARELRVILLTDDVAVGELWDDGYSLISPDGFTAVVRADEEGLDSGNIVLLPESRDLYRSVSAKLSSAAAD
jgi:hypothetical protein